MPPPGCNLAAASPGSSRALDGKRGTAAVYQYPHATTLVPVSLAGGLHPNPPPDPRAVGRIARLISHAADHRGRGRVSPRPGTYRSRRGERACSLAWHTRSVPSVLPWASCVRIHARGAMRDHPDPGLRLLCSRRSVEPEVSGFPRTPGLRCTTERPDRESTQAGSSSRLLYTLGEPCHPPLRAASGLVPSLSLDRACQREWADDRVLCPVRLRRRTGFRRNKLAEPVVPDTH